MATDRITSVSEWIGGVSEWRRVALVRDMEENRNLNFGRLLGVGRDHLLASPVLGLLRIFAIETRDVTIQ